MASSRFAMVLIFLLISAAHAAAYFPFRVAPPPAYRRPIPRPPVSHMAKNLERKLVAVEGIVFCKSCHYIGLNSSHRPPPLEGAVVKLQCNNTKSPFSDRTKTDRNGYFFFFPKHLSTMGAHKCKVYLVSSPLTKCSVPSNLHGGVTGVALLPSEAPPVEGVSRKLPYTLFSVGPFAFEPHKIHNCKNSTK